MKTHYLGQVTDKALEFITSEKGTPSRVGIYYGTKVGGRKVLKLVKAGPHIDSSKAANVYILKTVKKSGTTIITRFYDILEVIVYNRINHAQYHRLLLQYSRMRLRDVSAFGLPSEEAMLTDRDIARIIEISRGELIMQFGKAEYILRG